MSHSPAARLPRLRSDLSALPVYKAGARPSGEGPLFSLASNESPFEPSAAVLRAVAAAARQANRYPDPASSALMSALAAFHGVPADMLALGTGSVAVCQQLVSAAAAAGDEVLFAWRSFEAYPIVTGIAGARAVRVPLTSDARHDLPAMARAVTPATRAVFLCTPNNPTGPALSAAEVEDFLAMVPPDLLVVLDEAYHEYVTDPDVADGVRIALERPNVVSLRTLSKAYGLAGLRVGYAVGHPAVIAAVRSVAVPFGVSRIAEAAAVAVLAEWQEAAARAAAIAAERERVRGLLLADGWQVPLSQGNFVWLPLGRDSEAFAAACLARGFTVRAFPDEGVRVTVAEPSANDMFLEVAARWRA